MYTASELKKNYGGVQALNGVDFEVRGGEIQGLVGANGAGKSTLMKILVGAERPSGGTLALDGKPVRFADVNEAVDNGVAIVSQELNLFPDLTVLHNLFLLREPRHAGLLIDRTEMARRAEPVLAAVGLHADLHRRVGELRLGDQQLVEIARALLDDPKILFLDEPTSALQHAETARLFDVVRSLRERGVGIVYVSHVLDDVFEISDRITVLRNGEVAVQGRDRKSLTMAEVVSGMLGDAAPQLTRRVEVPAGESVAPPGGGLPLRLEQVSVDRYLEPFDLDVHPGEIVGLAGLDDSGVHAVFEVIFGQRRADGGTVTLPDRRRGPRSVTEAVRSSVAMVPADRKRYGVMLDKPIYENVATVRGGPLRGMGFLLRTRRMIERADHWTERLRIRTGSSRAPVGSLSGGNQHKVMLAKWLEADPSVVMLDDPTRGVDVGAKAEIHGIVAQMAARGRVVLVASSDLEELVTLCHRVVVFFRGKACGELRQGDLSEHTLMEAINTGALAAPAKGTNEKPA